ncbi:MAG: Gfa-like protein [Rhizobium sp.]|nr:Gfa-like protein [Rhizobium sp.]
MPDTWNGQCFCGGVRYGMHGRPMFIHCCHCRDCQRQTGSAFAINGLIEADRIELFGKTPEPVRMATESGHPHDIYRCTECRAPLWSDYGGRSWLRFLRLATLDRPDDFVPDVHIYTRSKLPWIVLPDGARAFEEYYDVRQEWPAASAARYRAAKDKASAAR